MPRIPGIWSWPPGSKKYALRAAAESGGLFAKGDNMEAVESRFLRYVAFDTQSDENSDTCPSTEKQRLLGEALAEEMGAMGIQDAHMDEFGYVYGTIPGDPEKPVIGLIAHMDTSPDASGANIKARIVPYDGGDICLNEEKNI